MAMNWCQRIERAGCSAVPESCMHAGMDAFIEHFVV
jgi:hypothetical protein